MEVLVATGIMGLVAGLAGTGLFQALTSTERVRAGYQVQGQTRTAAAWLLRDVPMAQDTDLVDGGQATNGATFSWTDYFQEGAVPHTVSYSIEDGDLVRTYDGLATVVSRNVGTVSFSRSGKLVTVTFSSEAVGRYGITDQKTVNAYFRSNPS